MVVVDALKNRRHAHIERKVLWQSERKSAHRLVCKVYQSFYLHPVDLPTMHGLDAECNALLNYVTIHCGLKRPKLYQHIDSPLGVLIYQAKVEPDKPDAGLAVKPSHHSKVIQYQAAVVCN
jgi:hypothetical protein